MSASIFPTLPLLDARAEKIPEWDGDDFVAPGGRRQSYLYSDRPRWRWRLRAHARGLAWRNVESEMEALWRFYNAHGGRWDSFLFRDPDDYSVSDHGFGVGDGATNVFQLQRAMAGSVSDVLGTWPLSTTGLANQLIYSEDLSNAAWIKNGVASVFFDVYVSPAGALTADAFLESTATSAHYIMQNYSQVASASQVGSIFAKGNAVRSQMRIEMGGLDGTAGYADFDLSAGAVHATSGGVTAGIVSVGDGWWRPWLGKNSGSGVSTPYFLVALLNGWASSYAGTGSDGIVMWGAMVERYAASPSRYVPSGATPGIVQPAYWPALSDGFEPITEPLWRSVVVKKDGTPVSFTPGASGQVALSPAPGMNQALTWSGSFYRRVRFAQRGLSMQRLMAGLWSAEGIELEMVI